MSQPDDKRYTRTQMLLGIQAAMAEYLDCDDLFDENTRFDEYMKQAGLWDDIDFADVFYDLEHFMGATDASRRRWMCETLNDWNKLFGSKDKRLSAEKWEVEYGQHITFGVLTDFLIERTPVIPIEPVWVMGRECKTAGAFRTIERICRLTEPRVKEFAPSTPIRARFRSGKQRQLWARLRWLSEGRLPPHRETAWFALRKLFNSRVGLISLGISYLVTVLLFFSVLGGPFTECLLITAGNFLFILVLAMALLSRFEDSLPEGFATFRDVACALAREPTKDIKQ